MALSVAAVTKTFGGLTALKDVSLTLEPAEIHGLIGPNGSGKTTLLNLLSGYVAPTQGDIAIDGNLLTKSPVQARPGVGVARTFQKPRILGTLTVLDNAMLGGWRDTRAGFVETALALARPRREERELRAYACEILEGVGLGHLALQRADRLDHAEQRLLEIARSLVMRPRFVLLDEPAGGLTNTEIDHLGAIVSAMRDTGMGVLLVEHHTDFVFKVSSRVTTLHFGQVIAHGSPDEVRGHSEVIRVYLGGETP
ncbi:ABC transporter ATP-binding protein [Reyranella sp.]|uniref:ABC transporter ATP-binding protein n=1 Tax=Reyranella sp. TaxID=1929291 RepID=UPI003784A657